MRDEWYLPNNKQGRIIHIYKIIVYENQVYMKFINNRRDYGASLLILPSLDDLSRKPFTLGNGSSLMNQKEKYDLFAAI